MRSKDARIARRLRRPPDRGDQDWQVDDRMFRDIVESAIDQAVITVSLAGKVTSWNSGAEKIFGYKSDEALGRAGALIYAREDRGADRFVEEMRLSDQGGRAAASCWHTRKNGERFWGGGLMMPLRDEDGRTIGYVKTVRDLTENRRLEKEVDDSRRQLALIVDALPTLVGYIDAHRRYAFANKAFERWFLKRREDIIGTRAADVLAPEQRELVSGYIDSALSGHRVTYEAHLAYPGGPRWIRAEYIPHFAVNGRVLGLVSLVTDITDFKRLEQDLNSVNAELDARVKERTSALKDTIRRLEGESAGRRRAEERASQHEREREEVGAMLDEAHDAIFLRDLDARILYWNKGAEGTYGYSREDALGTRSHELLRTRFPQPLNEIEDEVVRTGRWQGELVQTCRDGTRIYLTSRWLLQRDERGRPRAFLEINRDITSLREALDSLSRANRELEDLTFISAHDMQEPLRKIATYSQMLSRRYAGKLDAEADTFLRYLWEGAAKMKEVISAIVAYARVGRQEGKGSEVDLAEVVDRLLIELKPQIERTGAEIRRGSLPRVHGRRHQLETVLRQLLLNALTFTADRPPRIEIDSREAEQHWSVTVRDNGRGVLPEYQEKIFEPLRAPRQPRAGGLGIGLAICRRIIELHGGRLWVESDPGKGCDFTFVLPRRPPGWR